MFIKNNRIEMNCAITAIAIYASLDDPYPGPKSTRFVIVLANVAESQPPVKKILKIKKTR